MIRRSPLPLLAACLGLSLGSCGDGTGAAPGAGVPRLGGLCDSCERTADCEEPLGCQSHFCVDPAEPTSCSADVTPGDGSDFRPPEGLDRSCREVCGMAVAAECEAVGPGGSFGEGEEACWRRCVTELSEDVRRSCLRFRVENGDCGSDAFDDCAKLQELSTPGLAEDLSELCVEMCAAAAAPDCRAVGIGGVLADTVEECRTTCQDGDYGPVCHVACLKDRLNQKACASWSLAGCETGCEDEPEIPDPPGAGECVGEARTEPKCRCHTFCEAAASCGAFDIQGPTGEEAGDSQDHVEFCYAMCLDTPPDFLKCMEDLVAQGQCSYALFQECLRIIVDDSGGGGGEPPGEECVAYCEWAGGCEFLDAERGQDQGWCESGCGTMVKGNRTLGDCLRRVVGSAACPETESDECGFFGPGGYLSTAGPGGPDPRPQPDRNLCEDFCEWAEQCELLGEESEVAEDVPRCLGTCADLIEGNLQLAQCLDRIVENGQCGDGLAEDCAQYSN